MNTITATIKEVLRMAEMINPLPNTWSYPYTDTLLLQIRHTYFFRWISHNNAGFTFQVTHLLQQFPASRVDMPVWCRMPLSVICFVVFPHSPGRICLCCFQFQAANAAGNHRLDEDREGMPPPVENFAAQGQPQDLRYVDMGLYDMANDRPALHEHRDHVVNNYAGVAPDVPAYAQAALPAPVCTCLTFRVHTSNQIFRLRRSTYLTTQLGTLRLALLEASSMKCLTRALSPMG